MHDRVILNLETVYRTAGSESAVCAIRVTARCLDGNSKQVEVNTDRNGYLPPAELATTLRAVADAIDPRRLDALQPTYYAPGGM